MRESRNIPDYQGENHFAILAYAAAQKTSDSYRQNQKERSARSYRNMIDEESQEQEQDRLNIMRERNHKSACGREERKRKKRHERRNTIAGSQTSDFRQEEQKAT